MRHLLPLTALLCLLLVAPASANTRQALTFEAPRDLMNPVTRPAALAELQSLGVRSLRVILNVARRRRPGPNQPDPAELRPNQPPLLRVGRVRRR